MLSLPYLEICIDVHSDTKITKLHWCNSFLVFYCFASVQTKSFVLIMKTIQFNYVTDEFIFYQKADFKIWRFKHKNDACGRRSIWWRINITFQYALCIVWRLSLYHHIRVLCNVCRFILHRVWQGFHILGIVGIASFITVQSNGLRKQYDTWWPDSYIRLCAHYNISLSLSCRRILSECIWLLKCSSGTFCRLCV